MGVETQKYIRKPLYVDAVRVTAGNFDELVAWCQGEVLQDEIPGKGTTKKYIKVRVHNPKDIRQTKAFIGDWILYTDRGYKVYTNKAFRQAFDLVEGVEPKVETETPTRLGNVSLSPEEKDQLAVQELDKPLSEDEEVAQDRGEMWKHDHESPIKQAPDPGGEPVGEAAQEGSLVTATPIETVGEQVGEPVETVAEEPKVRTEAEAREEMDLPPREAVEDTPIAPPEPEARLQVETDAEDKIKHEPFSQGGGGSVDLAEDVRTEVESRKSIADEAPEVAAAGKRVLSEVEQRQLGPEEVRALVSTGDVVLAQDLVQQ